MTSASLANLIAARERRMDEITDGNSPYAIAYRELVAEYGAELVAQAMYVIDHEGDTRVIAEIHRKHYARMAYLTGADLVVDRMGSSGLHPRKVA